MNRKALADLTLNKIEENKDSLSKGFFKPQQINTFILDDLQEDIARKIYKAFPKKKGMMEKKSLREYKNMAAQMNKYNPLLEEAICSFRDPRIIEIVGEITKLKKLIADENLYAGGISLISKDGLLNPHLDNSHDNDRENYRVLNLLYSVAPKLGRILWGESGAMGQGSNKSTTNNL
jgi:Rps23 Pro-64 3,4-dihydroxylase Tpa1-like proline 4-hydroxylase